MPRRELASKMPPCSLLCIAALLLREPSVGAAAADATTTETAAADIVRRVLAGTPTFDDERGAVVVPAGPDCTSALNEAMLAANSAGGGTVATRDGAAYELDGPLNVVSHVRLRIGSGTTLRFGYSAPQRPPVLRSAEGVIFHGPSPLVRAYRAHGARVEGRGCLLYTSPSPRDRG